jgi:ornithine decarboxylase
MYGSFNCIAFDHAVVKAMPLCKSGTFITSQHSLQEFSSSVWGPTCDSIDLISKDCFLPEMQVGDWLRFNFMGAYTMAAASNLYYFINLAMASPRVRSFTSIHFPTNGSNPE